MTTFVEHTIPVFLFSVILFVVSGIAASLPLLKQPHLRRILGSGGAILSSSVGLFVAVTVLLQHDTITLQAPWSMPLGTFSIMIDPLAALFMIPLYILGGLGAWYGMRYLSDTENRTHWFYYSSLVASMAMVLASADGILFLVAWETMSLTSFMLVLHRHHEQESREAAWIYFIAAHVGTVFLLCFFLLAGATCGTLTFASFVAHRFSGSVASILFLCAFIGFGIKAGFIPFHVWLPRAHPAAPSHVSALMSGIMIKLGIYGIVRALTFLQPFQQWWGTVLIAIGCISGVLGVLLALGQHDLKRLLAFHSVENVGIIALGLGAGVTGVTADIPSLAVLGFAGGLLHVINHAFFKGLLFLGAGSVLHATGTVDIDRLGGLIKKMPATALCFLVGSAAISGLPPLNGFVSEFLIYIASFTGLRSPSIGVVGTLSVLMVSLALIGGLAAACFAKAFGVVFLGEPRTAGMQARESALPLLVPQVILAALCLVIGLFFWTTAPLFVTPIVIVSGDSVAAVKKIIGTYGASLTALCIMAFVFVAVTTTLYWYRTRLLRRRAVDHAPTWDCGYAMPTSRMQYTASSFAEPIIVFFRHILRPHRQSTISNAAFPRDWKLHTFVPDLMYEKIYAPLVLCADSLFGRLRWLQGGKVHTYILYIALTLIALLAWNFAWKP